MFDLKNTAIFWGLILGQIAVGILLLYYPPRFATEFWYALAHALLVAGLLALTVDIYLKKRTLKEVANDVSKFLVGYSLPAEVRDSIQDLMHETLIRRNSLLRIELVPLDNEAKEVKLKIEVSDEVENISSKGQIYIDEVSYEKHDKQTVTEMRCDSEDPKAQYCISGEKLVIVDNKDEPGVKCVRGKKIKLPGYSQKSGSKYQFRAKWEIILHENYSDVMSFAHPTINATVEVNCPPNFKFTLSPQADSENANRWEFHRLFLPDQHIRYRWERIKQQ